jgi:hypothetical protein
VDEDKFDRLLEALPRIAEAINQFQSPTVQEHAFRALTRALELAEPAADTPCEPTPPEVDFRSTGQQSLIDFAADRRLRNKNDQNLVAVYYLEQILGLQKITVDHVRAAYKECNWREPSSLLHSLQNTASQKSWISTRHMDDIRTTSTGANTVEKEMPFLASNR